MRALSEVRKEQLVGFFSCCVAAQLPRRMESMRLLVALFWVRSNMHTECLCSLMYRLMYTRALLQSKDHSVGSKRYLSRLERRAEYFVSPLDEALPRVSLECNPEIPVAPGEEHYVLDKSLDEVYFALQ